MEKTCFLLSIAVVHYLVITCTAKTVTNNNIGSDESALLALKANISSDPHGALVKNWSVATSVCNWVGVTCSARHQRVRALNISDMALQGTIPPHLGNLSFLVSLDISGNSFSGHLPNELANLRRLKLINVRSNRFSGGLPSWSIALSQLEHLLLADNRFTGSIPATIFNISSLQSIDLSMNGVFGNLPVNMCDHLPKLVRLNLSSSELNGQIPSTIYKCSGLQILSLADNRFTGPIPREIGNLTMLKELYLGFIPPTIFTMSSLQSIDFSKNNLSGNLPVDVCNHLPKLEVLVLQYNKLITGQIASTLYNCSKLQFLDLDSNGFSGPIPREIGNFTMLKRLLLADNFLQGGIPEDIGNLKLEELVLQFNHLTGPIPAAIFNISTLRTRVSLVHNELSGNLPSDIGHSLPNLEALYLAENNLTGVIPHSISNASNLIDLELSVNKFSGAIPHSLGKLTILRRLSLYGNNLNSDFESPELSFLTSLTNCRHLTDLQLGYNPLNVKLPTSIGNLSTSLQYFDVDNCGIMGNIPAGIGNLSSLIFLYLFDNEFTGLVPTTIKELRELQRLYLDYNRIQGSIPLGLCHLQNLGELGLDENRLSGRIPTCLGNVTSLRYLYLDSNRLTSTIPAPLLSLKDLLILNLSSNSLSGYLPQEMGSLKVAIQIDLSMNQFTGNIPSTIGSLQDLTNLSLANNRLQGPIPDVFRSMVGLEFLDLSHNNLSGAIPWSLETLLHLTYFNVSFNRLRGEIPTGGHFANFTNQSFMSNEALCGAPQFQVLPCHNTTSLHRSRIKRVLLVMYIMLPIAAILLVLTVVGFVCLKCRKKNETPIQTASILATERERITYHQLLQATDGFRESNLLGIGSFGSVYKAILIDGTILAVKVFNLQLEGAFKSFDTECEILRNIRHRNLTKVISSCSNLDFKALILQYMPNGSLEKWLYSHNYFLDILQRLDVMIDVACAIDYLHNGYSTSIVHCDLKPSNVLLDEDMVAHVSDFGIGKFLGDGDSTAITKTLATFGYIAPEYGMEGLVSTRCDVYSYGIMLMETFTRRKPTDELFSGDLSLKGWVKESLPNALIQVIDSNLLRPEEEDFNAKVQCVSSIMELGMNCSAESPQERINMADVLAALEKIRLRFLTNRVQSCGKLGMEMKHESFHLT